jgi:hypothetical protein
MKTEKQQIIVGELLEALDSLKTVTSIDIVTDLAVVAFHDNYIMARNNSCFIAKRFTHPFEKCVLPYIQFRDFLTKFGASKRLTMWQEDKKVKAFFKVKKGKRKTSASMALLPSIWKRQFETTMEFVKLRKKMKDEMKKIPEDFPFALKSCLPTLPRESLRFDLTLFSIDNRNITSCDDSRISRFKMGKGFGKDVLFYLSRQDATTVINLDFNKYFFREGFIHFVSKDLYAKFALPVDISYPPVTDDMFDYDRHVTVAVAPLIALLERTILFAEGKTDIAKIATLEISDGVYTLKAKNSFGKSVESNKLTGDIEVKLFLNPIYLSQILSAVSPKKVDIGIVDSGNGYKLIFNEERFKYLMVSYTR